MLNIYRNKFFTGDTCPLFTVDLAKEIREFHKKIDNYKPTPLVSLPNLANKLGVKAIYVKDESYRFGLNAFKVLGGSYALGRILAEHLQLDIGDIDLKTVANKLDKPLVFATATAGNHGIGIAWAAREMGQKAYIYMPKGSSAISVERVKKLGAQCMVTDLNYDDTVRLVSELADKNSWFLVQDTAWEGYEKIPNWIAQGYMTMADEAAEQFLNMESLRNNQPLNKSDDPNKLEDVALKREPYNIDQLKQVDNNSNPDYTITTDGMDDAGNLEGLKHKNTTGPTHLFLQAGVGSMAGSVLGYFADKFGANNLTSIIAEPITADCILKSGTSADGNTVGVGGDLKTIMAGLACGVPNPVTWQILKDCSQYFAAVDDGVPATGMRVLGNPIADDPRVISGGSGAISLGLLYKLCGFENSAEIRKKLGLDKNSVIMIFSTEGDTNPQLYQDIVWNGALSI